MFTLFALALLPTDAIAANCNRQPQRCDSDADGLNNQLESSLGTNPFDADTDDDSLSDGQEVNVTGTNPRQADTDTDGLDDGDEISAGSDPHDPDTDGDGIDDGDEVYVTGTDPLLADTDGDGSADPIDVFPLDPAEWSDIDCDGIGDNADPDDDNNGIADVDQWLGGSSVADLVSAYGTVLMDLEVCPWSLQGDPSCEFYVVEMQGAGVMVEQSGGAVGQYIEGSSLGSHTLIGAWPTLDTASLRFNGVQVDPGSDLACYEGLVEALGGWYVVGGASGSYWFATGHFSACLY